MLKNRTSLKTLFLVGFVAVFLLGFVIKEENKNIFNETKKLNVNTEKIAITSDLHLPSFKEGQDKTTLIEYGNELFEALCLDAKNEGISILVMCGDNTNDGKISQHKDLIEKLEKAKNSGLNIFVIPGNHDLTSISKEEYEKLYLPYGREDALSLDSDSLSYSVLVDDKLFLLLDTISNSKDLMNAEIKKSTLKWVEANLKFAQDNKLKVLCFGHYPILSEQPIKIKNKEKLETLLKKYDVPLYIGGHNHGKSVTVKDDLVELIIEQPISYPCSYEIVYLKDDSYTLISKNIDMQNYVNKSGTIDANLINFEMFKEGNICSMSNSIIDDLAKDKGFSSNKIVSAKDFFFKFWKYRSEGVLDLRREELINSKGYELFLEISKNTIYNTWVPKVMDSSSAYMRGFKLVNNKIESLD